MTDQSREAITDKLAAIETRPTAARLEWDSERHTAYFKEGIDITGFGDSLVVRRYLSETDPDWFDTSDWNAMVEWENTRYLLDVYDLKGPDAALLHRLGQNTIL